MDVTNLIDAAVPAAASTSCLPAAADGSSAALAALFADLVEQLAAFDVSAGAAAAAPCRESRRASQDDVGVSDGVDDDAADESATLLAIVPGQLAAVWTLPVDSGENEPAAIDLQSGRDRAPAASGDASSVGADDDALGAQAKAPSTVGPQAGLEIFAEEAPGTTSEPVEEPANAMASQPRAGADAAAEDCGTADAPAPVRSAAARALARALAPTGHESMKSESTGTRPDAVTSAGAPAARLANAPPLDAPPGRPVVSAMPAAVSSRAATAPATAAAQVPASIGPSDPSHEPSATSGNGSDAGHGRQGDTPREPIASARVSTTFGTAIVDVTAPQVQPAAAGAAPAGVAPSTPASGDAAAAPVEQIVRAIQVRVRDGVSEAVVRLRPDHLGEVRIALTVERGAVTAVLHADRPEVRAQIVAHADTLKEALSGQGLRLDELVVREDGQRQPQERPGGEQQPPPRRFRRVPTRAFDLPGDR